VPLAINVIALTISIKKLSAGSNRSISKNFLDSITSSISLITSNFNNNRHYNNRKFVGQTAQEQEATILPLLATLAIASIMILSPLAYGQSAPSRAHLSFFD
jgi:hypothetical protein